MRISTSSPRLWAVLALAICFGPAALTVIGMASVAPNSMTVAMRAPPEISLCEFIFRTSVGSLTRRESDNRDSAMRRTTRRARGANCKKERRPLYKGRARYLLHLERADVTRRRARKTALLHARRRTPGQDRVDRGISRQERVRLGRAAV